MSIVQAWELCKVGTINLSYESLISPEVRQTLVGLRNVDSSFYEQLSTPALSVPFPPPPPKCYGSYPKDEEHEDDEAFVNSSLSVDEVIAWIADEAPRELVDFSDDEDEGADGFRVEDLHVPARTLEPFNAQRATSYWPQWDGHANSM